MEDAARWILSNGLMPAPTIDPVRLLTRKLKQAARRRRFRDPQGRLVRKMVAAKIERVDARGNTMFDVVWDFLHEMSVDHALTSLSQRDAIIEQQRRSATRDVQSFLDNNPSAHGYRSQFVFGFMLEEAAPVIEEEVEETPVVRRSLPEGDEIGAGNPLTKEKPK
jgi:hypothetical protein